MNSAVASDPIPAVRALIKKHHASEGKLKRLQAKREALIKLGYTRAAQAVQAFPVSEITRKGNLAEVILAEYLLAQPGVQVPVYRLRYNPNTDQSMKGDDVLAFEFNQKTVRVIVGETKYRGTPAIAAIRDIGDALTASHKSGMPASLEFVADRLYEEGNEELGNKVSLCTSLFAEGRLQLDFAGLLVSTTGAAACVERAEGINLQRLVIISLGIDQPDMFVQNCYNGLE